MYWLWHVSSLPSPPLAALSYEITNIVFYDVHPETTPEHSPWIYAALFADFIFLAWIYLAMSSTIRVLNEYQQTHKLEMYDNLWITIGVFVVQFLALSTVMSLSECSLFRAAFNLFFPCPRLL